MWPVQAVVFITSLILHDATGTPSVELRGAGASFPEAVYQAWIPSYVASRQTRISIAMRYDAVGSGDGKRRIKGDLVADEAPIDFAGSDSLLDEKDYIEHPGLVMFPSMAGAVVLGYNIPDLKGQLTLSMEVLVGIYNGTIRFWNDTLITRLNANITLPSEEIIVLARRDKSGTTDIFTSALSTIPSWNETYGTFSLMSGWKDGAIQYYGYKNTGISGLVLSFAYSIAYISVAEAAQAGVSTAAMLNSYGNVITAKPAAIQAAMDQALVEKGHLVVNLVEHPHPKAYPIAAYTYLIVHKNTTENCKAMLELVRYIDWFLTVAFARKVCEEKEMVPLSKKVAKTIRAQVLQGMECDGSNLWDKYQGALSKEKFERQLSWLIPTLVGAALVILFVVSIVTFFTVKALRFRKMLEKNEWAIDISEIIFYTTYRSDVDGRSRFVMWPSVTSLTDVEEIEDGYQMVEQILQWPGKYMGQTVGMRLLEIKEISKLTNDIKTLFLWMTEHVVHTNVLNLIGLAEFQESWYCVSDYCAKGPLYNILKDEKYNLTKDFKYSIAMDIVNGLQYLHSKDIIVGCLRSSSCLVDFKWTVKIADWEYVKIYTKLKNKINPLLFIHKNPDEVGEEEAAFLNFWIAPEIVKSGMMEFPCEASDIYSYGIILHEVFTRKDPYFEHYDSMSRSDLLKAVINNHLRPKHGHDSPTSIRQLLDYTWSEDPLKRPSTGEIQKMLQNGHTYKKSVLDSMIEAVDEYTAALEEKLDDTTNMLELSEFKLSHLMNRVMPRQFLVDEVNGSTVEDEKTFVVSCVVIQLQNMPSAGTNLSQYMASVDSYLFSVAQRHNAYMVDLTNGKYAFFLGLDVTAYNAADAAMLASDIVWNIQPDVCDCLTGRVLCVIHKGPLEVTYTISNLPRCHVKGDFLETAHKMLALTKTKCILISQQFRDAIAPLEDKLYKLSPREELINKDDNVGKTYWLEVVESGNSKASPQTTPNLRRALARALYDATNEDEVSLSDVKISPGVTRNGPKSSLRKVAFENASQMV